MIGFSKYERHPDNAVCDVYLHETLQKKPIEACLKANERSRKLPQFFHVAQIKLLPRSDAFWLFDDRSVRKVVRTRACSSSYINGLEPLVYRKCRVSRSLLRCFFIVHLTVQPNLFRLVSCRFVPSFLFKPFLFLFILIFISLSPLSYVLQPSLIARSFVHGLLNKREPSAD